MDLGAARRGALPTVSETIYKGKASEIEEVVSVAQKQGRALTVAKGVEDLDNEEDGGLGGDDADVAGEGEFEKGVVLRNGELDGFGVDEAFVGGADDILGLGAGFKGREVDFKGLDDDDGHGDVGDKSGLRGEHKLGGDDGGGDGPRDSDELALQKGSEGVDSARFDEEDSVKVAVLGRADPDVVRPFRHTADERDSSLVRGTGDGGRVWQKAVTQLDARASQKRLALLIVCQLVRNRHLRVGSKDMTFDERI